MRFLSFVKQNSDQNHPALKSLIRYALNDKKFPLSSDPRIIALYLYSRLDHNQTKGFQAFMMLYKKMEPKNQLPAELKNDDQAFLDAINVIVHLQG